jgi:hypothetical protein
MVRIELLEIALEFLLQLANFESTSLLQRGSHPPLDTICG